MVHCRGQPSVPWTGNPDLDGLILLTCSALLHPFASLFLLKPLRGGGKGWDLMGSGSRGGTQSVNPLPMLNSCKLGPVTAWLEGYREQLGHGLGWVWEAAGAWFDPENVGGAEPELWPLLHTPRLILS